MDPFVSDEEFLLRCAATYNWNPLLERCLLMKDVFSSLNLINANQRAFVAASYHQQLIARDQWGNTAFHLACFHSAPIRVIVSLLEAAGAADPPIQLTSFLTGDGSTVLLIACATRASPETIQVLLNPPVEGLTRGGLQATFPDEQGSTPLSELWTLYEKRKNRPLSPKSILANEQQLWTNIEAIMDEAWHSNADISGEEPITMFHSIANVAESCPPPLADLLLAHYPDTSSLRDERCLVPLHIAISGRSTHSHQKLKEQRSYMIAKLLDLYPEAARMALPGKRPRSPFCTAIASGLDWHVMSSTPSTSEGPLLKLWQCAPEALPSRDMESGLHCFLLAATVERHDTDDDSAKVNNIYNILRLYPQAIQDMIS